MATTHYRTIAFIDSNIVLEARPLAELPWQEVDSIGPILVVLAPTVLREVDSKKRDGRIGPKARAFNRFIAPLASGASSISLLAESPRVDLALAVPGKIDWDSYDDLDRSQGDHNLVAEILNTKGLSSAAILVSQDINPLFAAQRHGVRTLRIPETWRPPLEPSPQDKEIARLKKQMADYQKAEPKFEIDFAVPGQPIQVYDVVPLTADQALKFRLSLTAANPRVKQHHSPLALSSFEYDPSLDSRYDRYINHVLPTFVANYHDGLEILFNQAVFTLTVTNIGNALAANLLIDVEIVGGWINEKAVVFNAAGPKAPRPRPSYINQIPDLSRLHPRVEVGRHEVEVSDTARAPRVVAQCEDFRQGQCWTLTGFVWIDPRVPKTLAKIKITAATLTGEQLQVFEVQKTSSKVAVSELVDLEPDPKLRKKSCLQEHLERAFESEDYSAIEWTIGVPQQDDD
ncbi:MAG TPA: hypothetical protein VFE23_15790 [Usitatibacter sp.]|jgi:hypothetical protein|nr:hypothetical protein [Usitatibacter sp.]